MRHRRNRLTWLTLAVWGISSTLAAPSERAPAGAVKATRDYLELAIARAKADSTYFHSKWYVDGVTDLSAISLGEPYGRYRLSSQAIRDFADSKVAEFEDGAELLCWAFPVFYHDNYIGTIEVRFAYGTWGFGGMGLARGNRLAPFMSRIREQYPSERGYCVSTITTDRIGAYVLLYANGELSKIAQVAPDPYGTIGFPMDENGIGLLVPIEQVRDHLRTLAKRTYEKRSHKPPRQR